MTGRETVYVVMAVVGIGASLFLGVIQHGEQQERCEQTVRDRPCIAGTVEYDGDGECECGSRYGEIEWEIGDGCDMD